MREIEGKEGHLLRKLLVDARLDAEIIMNALGDPSIPWGHNLDVIEKLIKNPEPEDILRLVADSKELLKPLEDWLVIERKFNELQKPIIPMDEYYHNEYCYSQLLNFSLTIKLY